MPYTSANVPEMFKKVPQELRLTIAIHGRSRVVNLNCGDCSEDVTIYLAEQGIKNIVYTGERADGKKVTDYIIERGGADSVTIPTQLCMKLSWRNRGDFDAVLYYVNFLMKKTAYVFIGIPENDPQIVKRVKIIANRLRVMQVCSTHILAQKHPEFPQGGVDPVSLIPPRLRQGIRR